VRRAGYPLPSEQLINIITLLPLCQAFFASFFVFFKKIYLFTPFCADIPLTEKKKHAIIAVINRFGKRRYKMLGILRTVFSVIGSLCVAAVPLVGIYAGWFYVIYLGVGLLVSFMITLILKYVQEEKERGKDKKDGKDE